MTGEVERLREAEERALRVLYHVISTNKHFDTLRPNELTDDAIRIGHEFLLERGWWPAPGLPSPRSKPRTVNQMIGNEAPGYKPPAP